MLLEIFHFTKGPCIIRLQDSNKLLDLETANIPRQNPDMHLPHPDKCFLFQTLSSLPW